MKRVGMTTMLAVIFAAQFWTGAQAAKQPHGPNVIQGTNHGEVLRGGNGPDLIYGLGGKDIIWTNRGPDSAYGGKGNDRLHGYGAGESKDFLDGGAGHDVCVGTKHDRFRNCEVVVIRRGLGPR